MSVGVENETPFIRVQKPLSVWKPLPSRRVLKTLRGTRKRKAQRGQYLLAVGLGRYKWYQSQILGNVQVRRLFPEGVDTRRCASKDAGSEGGGFGGGPTSIGEKNEC